MAKYSSGILGAFSGKVGKVVGSSWRGISYIKSLPSHVANPRTPAQVAMRNLLSVTSAGLRPFLSALQRGFIARKGLSSWNLAVTINRNIIQAASTQYGSYAFDHTKLILSSGSEPFSLSLSLSSTSASLEWDNVESSHSLSGGSLYFVVYNVTQRTVRLSTFDLSAESGSVDVDSARLDSADVLYAYSFAASSLASSATLYHPIA